MRRDPEAGLSLIEILVVLAILGVATGGALLAFGRADAVRVEAEARRLADRLQLAADEALVTGVPLALVLTADGYRFLLWDAEAAHWRAPGPGPLARHSLPRGLTIEGGRALLVLPEPAQAPVAFRLSDGGTIWRVRFDGVSTEAEPGAG